MRLNFRNYDHVAGLWKHENWLPQAAVALARAHYAAYMVKRVDGLRIITLNTDMCTSLVILLNVAAAEPSYFLCRVSVGLLSLEIQASI
jgi:hypothetical protein